MKDNDNNTMLLKAEFAGDAEVLQAKAEHYLVCFHDGCERHAQCLRWVVGLYNNDNEVAKFAINPRCRDMQNGHCPLFRSCEKTVMKHGLTHFYEGMTGKQERQIRQLLIARFNRKTYYQIRNGKRLIAPGEQHDIEALCRKCGWTGPFVYDGETEDYVW